MDEETRTLREQGRILPTTLCPGSPAICPAPLVNGTSGPQWIADDGPSLWGSLRDMSAHTLASYGPLPGGKVILQPQWGACQAG